MLTSITGINWGDEGKGRMVDLLSQDYDIVARYQGGDNVRTALFTCVEARVAYSFKPSLMASAISSMLTVLLIRLPPLQTAMNLQDLLLIVHRVNGFDIVELLPEADAETGGSQTSRLTAPPNREHHALRRAGSSLRRRLRSDAGRLRDAG